MNTSLPLLNVVSGSQATASRSSNQADSFSAEAPFKQVLSSQVNSRNAESHQQDQPKAPEKEAAQPAQPAPQQQSASSSGTRKADADSAKKDDDSDQDDDTDTAASAQLLALVANLEQNAVKPVGDDKGESTEGDLLAQAKRGAPKLSLQGEDQPATEGRGKKTDFAAVQDSALANSKKEATPDLAQQNQLDAARAAKAGEKSPAELGAEGKAATPQADLTAVAARAQGAKTAADAFNLRQDNAPLTPAPVALPAMQQAVAAAQPQAVFGTYTDKIQPNVGSAGWDQAVGQKVTWMVSGGLQSATLSLNPPDLGPLQVVLSVNNSQADATFTTAQPEVKQALENAMPRLREMMEQAGIQLGQATVNTGMPNQQQGQGQQAARSSSGRAFGDDAEAEVLAVTTPVTASGGLGIVDTFA
ncbi:flagellar hook-length control protein FliK [Herbaspirillum sp. YR522]|uniref:flagellar hook-length control protein FliK n=1 Tax=Herbaspirillum sp. YR522 TaxID=1144342 RepID=UPI00026F64E9|nr:flagellar hook-length control protein FliK [Herbaspirillum sp. YR522]EJN08282.1 flagellar hook-length control protein [Herbaspirillum sp. YR522]